MPLEEFPLLQDNTRLLRHKDTLYKVKVKYTEHTSESVPTGISRKQAHAQIENTFRALLYIIQREEELNLKPVVTENFLITVVTAPWSFTQRYGFTQHGKELKAYPLQFDFRIEIRNDTHQDEILTKVVTSDINSTDNAIAGSSKETPKVVADKSTAAPGPRFTRSKGGRLLHDGNRFIQVESDKQKTNEAESARGSERITGTFTKSSSQPKVIDNSSVNKKERLKRKLQSEIDLSENQSVESVKLGSADKGLDVERFHNRNNSGQSVSPRYSGHRLRDRKYRKLSPSLKNVHKRQSERLRSKERLRYKDSSSEISDTGENFRKKRKKYISLDNCNTIEVTDFNDSRHNTRDQDVDMLRDSRITEESQTENSTRRRRDGSKKDISEKPRAGHGDERKQNKVQHTKEPQSEISETNEKQHRNLKTNTEMAQETKAKKHKLYTEKESPFLISNQQPNVTDQSINSPRVSTVLPQKRARPHLDLQSPRTIRQGTLVRSPLPRADFIASSQPANHQHALDEESQRIQRMRQQAPQRTYHNILLAQSRDRHMIEQAERAETDKLQQLYEPTAVRRSPRLQEREKESSLWQKIVGTFLTPVKNMMTGNSSR